MSAPKVVDDRALGPAPSPLTPARGQADIRGSGARRPVPRPLTPVARAAALVGVQGPGLALTLGLALAATILARLVPLAGAAVLAIALGVAFRLRFGLPSRARPGVRASSKHVLQLAIVLLGSGMSLSQVWTTGAHSLLVLLGTLIGGMAFILWLGPRLGVDPTLTRLIGAGTGICGASAIGAVAPILGATEGEIAYAISTIFLFNIAGVLLFPPLGHLLGLSQQGFGLWAGTAINDTSSVTAAGYAFGTTAGAYAVVVKLTRTVMIVPVSLFFAVRVARERRGAVDPTSHASPEPAPPARVGPPPFILFFLLASALHTFGLLGPLGSALPPIGTFLIAVALAGVGLSADLSAMIRTGWRPLALGLLGWICVGGLSLLLQLLSHTG